jgi:cell division transport system permease protein
LDIGSRREEISVLQELGATDGFIRRPFLYQGSWLGLLAGGLAIGLLSIALWYLQGPLNELLTSYSSGFRLRSLNLVQAAAIVLASGLLGFLGAWLASGHYLRQTRP